MKYVKLLFVFFITFSFAQNNKIDSLKNVLLQHQSRDTIRVNIINKLAREIFLNDKEKSKKILDEACEISDNLNYVDGKNESLYLLGKTLTEALKFDEAEKTINLAIKGFKGVGNDLGVAKSLNQLGVIYYYKIDNEKALDFFYKALNENKKSKDATLFANLYNNIGLICDAQDKKDEALEFYIKSLAIHRQLKKYKNIAISLNNIGIIYNDKNEKEKALKSYKECLEISEKINNKYLVAFSYHNIGLLFEDKKDYHKALDYLFKALTIQKEIKNSSGICYAYNGISSVYIKLKKYNEALKYILINEKIAKKYNLLKHQLSINKMLSQIYKAKKDYKKALFYQVLYKKDYDSVNKIEATNKFVDLENKYKFKEKELKAKENEIELNKKIDLANKKLYKTKKQVLYGLIMVLFLFVLLGFLIYNSRIRRLSLEYQKVVLKQKLLRSQMKPHFIFNSLSVLQGIVLHKEYDKASIYISKFSRLLRDILENSKEEIINLETEIRIIESYIFLQKISHTSSCLYHISVDERINIKNFYIPPMIVQPIVENSYEHGFIELNKSYELSIDFKLEDDKLICTIIDNGEGIESSSKKNYFEKKKSFSSTIIKERLELFSKKYGEKYNFEVIDRKKDGLKGTKVVLLLPYKIENHD